MYQLCIGKSIVPTSRVEYEPIAITQDINGVIDAHQIIKQRLKVMSFIDYVEDSYHDFEDYRNTLTHPNLHNDIALERKARSFFIEFDIFHDHWKKYMSFRNRKEEFDDVFTKETHDAFDSNDQYALATIIRNYAAHQSDVIQGRFWGNNTYDVGASKGVLLDDKKLNATKRNIINKQPAQFISLSPIMRSALETLKAIHLAFLKFDIDDKDIKAARTISNIINSIKDKDLSEKRLYFVNSVRTPLTVYSADNIPLETVYATEQIPFDWKEYTHVLDFLLE